MPTARDAATAYFLATCQQSWHLEVVQCHRCRGGWPTVGVVNVAASAARIAAVFESRCDDHWPARRRTATEQADPPCPARQIIAYPGDGEPGTTPGQEG